MRKTTTCPKCRHNVILHIAKVPDTGEYESEIRHFNIATIFLGEGIFRDKTDRAGAVTASVCEKCGFIELYCTDPEKIPVDGKYVVRTVAPEPEGPYR